MYNLTKTIRYTAMLSLFALGSLSGHAFGEAGALWHSGGKLAADGAELFSKDLGNDISVNPLTGEYTEMTAIQVRDEDGWYDASHSEIYKWSPEGELLATKEVEFAWYGALDPVRDIYWTSDVRVRSYDQELTERFSISYFPDFVWSYEICANPLDGSVWLSLSKGLAHIDVNGNLLQLIDTPDHLNRRLALKPADNSCWTLARALSENFYVSKFLADGTMAYRTHVENAELDEIHINPVDDSCWLVDDGHNQLIKLDAYGHELFRIENVQGCAIDPFDGSAWTHHKELGIMKLSSKGDLLFSTGTRGRPLAVVTGKLYSGFSAIEHANSNNRLWADEALVELKPNSRKGERAQWVMTYLGSGFARIINRKTGERLQANLNGTSLTMTTQSDDKALWAVERSKDGSYFHLKNKHFGTYLRGHDERGLWLENERKPGPNFRWVLTNQ